MAITIVGEPVIARGELLKALTSNAGEISGELGVFSQDDRSPSHKGVDQRLLPHSLVSLSKTLTLTEPECQFLGERENVVEERQTNEGMGEKCGNLEGILYIFGERNV